METGVTDPDRCQAPSPLRDRPGFWGAGITEALPTSTTVVLGVVGLELFPTFMTFLLHTEFYVFVYFGTQCGHFYQILFSVSYQNKGIGFPVGGSNLVSKPGRDCFGRFDAEFRHWLRNVFDSIQQPLGSIVVVFQKTIRLKRSQQNKRALVVHIITEHSHLSL